MDITFIANLLTCLAQLVPLACARPLNSLMMCAPPAVPAGAPRAPDQAGVACHGPPVGQ